MPEPGCEEQSALAKAVVAATNKVYLAKAELDAAKSKGINTESHVVELRDARTEERRAVAALDGHKKEHGCGVEKPKKLV